MPDYINKYFKGWKQELGGFSPKGWSFVSFIAPLVAIPLAVKGAQYAAKEIKKAVDKNKAKKRR
ncbi:MAG: hypothetical protein ACFFG0_46250 [Candidatus Thorarchaeota archaeon]